MSVTHELKTLPAYFDAVERGEKTFEVRRDDRGFQKGDILRLREWLPNGKPNALLTTETRPQFSGREVSRRVLWILTGGQFGIEPGHVVMAIGPVDGPTPPLAGFSSAKNI